MSDHAEIDDREKFLVKFSPENTITKHYGTIFTLKSASANHL